MTYSPQTRKVSIYRSIFRLLPMVLLAVLSQSGCGLTFGNGNLVVSPTGLNFGNVAIGSRSDQSLTITNSGNAAITLIQIVASGGGFTLKGPTLPLTLAGGQSATVTITFAPSAMGSVSGSLAITRSQSTSHRASTASVPMAPVVTTQTVTISAAGVPATPSITTQPTNQTVIVGQTATFSVTASGVSPLSYQWSKNGTAISGATSASYTTPATTISDNGSPFTLIVSNSGGAVTSAAATLTVDATPPGQLVASASTLNFNNLNVGSRSTLGLTFTNTGSSNLTFSSVSISGAGYTASGMSSGLILTPGQTSTLNVTFAPSATGGVTGNANVTSDASNSPASITLSGTGIQPGAHSATLAWPASTASSVTGYNVYRATVSGGYTTPLNSAPLPTPTTQFEDSTVQAGQTYYYVFTDVDSSKVESAYSNEVSRTIPTP